MCQGKILQRVCGFAVAQEKLIRRTVADDKSSFLCSGIRESKE